MAVKARAEITLSSIRDVQSVTRYYLLQSSTSAKPNKPTTNPPGGSWVKAEPTYTTGSTNSLYFVDLTVFSDGTFAYSDVSLSSSYEAAKVAYNKAATAQENIENLSVGGRNYILKSGQVLERSGGPWIHLMLKSSELIPADTTITISLRIDADDIVWGTYNYYRIGMEISNPKATSGTQYMGCWAYRSGYTGTGPAASITGNSFHDRISFTWTAETDIAANHNVGIYIQGISSGTVIVSKAKLEIGNTATDWTPAPEDLDEAITAAQTTANGKNTVYYQASAPSGGTYKVNDIWFETDNGNKMYMWNGSTWVAEQFGNAAISDLSITNAKIANATIQSAKIANLDAGKVTTGTMSAARIKGDTLTLGGENNVDGMLAVYDASGALVGSFTREGLMAIAGTIGGWTIGEEDLTGEWDVGTEHWMIGLSKAYGLRFKEVPQGGDPTTDWTREVQYNAGLASFSSKENSETYHGAIENYPGENGLRIYPKLIVGDHSSSEVTEISTDQIDTKKVRLTELWAHPLGYGDSFYMRQPLMIMADVVTISTGTSEKNLTLCTIPAAYQSGYRIVPFVSRRYSSQSGTPSDTGDFYYAYYNSVTHNVHIKLANKLPSGAIFQFDYMIYAVPETT